MGHPPPHAEAVASVSAASHCQQTAVRHSVWSTDQRYFKNLAISTTSECLIKMRDTNDGDRVLAVSAHVLSRALMSQSASVTCCTLARVVVLFVLHVNIVFVVYCVNIVFM
jgi:hypothetical protein